MKRFYAIFIGCVFCLYLRGQNNTQYIPDASLMIANAFVNQGEFDAASEMLFSVQNWHYCDSQDKPDSIKYVYNYSETYPFKTIYTEDGEDYIQNEYQVVLLAFDQVKKFIEYLEDHPIDVEFRNNFLLYYKEQINVSLRNTLNKSPYRVSPQMIRANIDRYMILSWLHEKLSEPIDSNYVKMLWDAGLYAEEHKYENATIQFMWEAYKNLYMLYGRTSSYTMLASLFLGNKCLEQGHYIDAIKMLNESILDPKCITTPIAHLLLGNIYIDLCDYKQAEFHYNQAVSTSKKHKFSYATIFAYWGLAYKSFIEEDFLSTNKYARKAATYPIKKRKAEENDQIVYYILSKNHTASRNIAAILLALGEYESIKNNHLQIINDNESQDFDKMLAYKYLGIIYYNEQKYKLALDYFWKAHDMAYWGFHHHPEHAKILRNYIRLYYAMETPDLAESLILESAAANKNLFIQSVSILTEKQREQYWKDMQEDFERTYPNFVYRFYKKNLKLSPFAYDNELFTKGLLLTSSDAVRRSVLSSGDTVLIAQWEELTALRQAIKAMQERMTDIERIDEYEQRAEELEKIITVNSAAYRENMQQWSITWDSVRKALKPKQVAIEYMSAPINEDSTMYCALLLRDTCSQPILIPLFEQKEVDTLLYTSTKDSVEIRKTYTYINHGKALSDRIWSNVKPYLNAGDTVYFSATGVLHQIAIENLWCDSTHTMADMYTMVRLSSTRELAIERESIQNETATLYGGIYYSAEAQTMVDVHKKQKFNADTQDKFLAYNQTRGGLAHANPLTATQYEISATEAILKDKHFHVEVLSGHMANEESFKHLSGQKQNILHIATHGFYTPDSTFQNPLERCGLLFAGANILIDGNIQQLRNIDKNVEDGLVTAKDISLMDLRGADIVVLSACETGLGDVTGEGVFGLQRAFKMAGAQTLIMSLWQVHDLSTQILMTAFYKHWIEKGESKHQAFRAAQQEVRNSGFDSPYYWAGFILLD